MIPDDAAGTLDDARRAEPGTSAVPPLLTRSRESRWEPDWPIRFEVTCRTSKDPTAPTTRHPITLDRGWTLDTGHDLAAERISVALGGYSSCLALSERALPAAMPWFLQNRRAIHPGIKSTSGTRWTVIDRASCCPRSGFANVVDAAEHVRSVEHHATAADYDPALLRVLARALEPHLDPAPPGSRLGALWAAGLHPDAVARVEQRLGSTDPLSAPTHLAIMAATPDMTWLADVLVRIHDPRALPQVIWAARKWRRTVHGLDWLALPIPPRLGLLLSTAGYSPASVSRLAAAQESTLSAAAGVLATWLRAGHHPMVSDLVRLAEVSHQPLTRAPSAAAVERARDLSDPMRSMEGTEIALLIAEHGSVPAAVSAVSEETARSGPPDQDRSPSNSTHDPRSRT